MMKHAHPMLLTIFGLLCHCSSSSMAAAEGAKVTPREIALSRLKAPEDVQFCGNIKDQAREKRYALKTKELNLLKAGVEERIVALEKKRAEFEAWKKQRDDFANQAEETLVEIYSKMRPDAAAGRLEFLSVALAAAILLKLPPRKSGVILNEMKAERAAVITTAIAASIEKDERS